MSKFAVLLSLSVSGSLLALLLLALKPLLMKKATRVFMYYLWMIVLLRLILPISTPIDWMDALLAHPPSGVIDNMSRDAYQFSSHNMVSSAREQRQPTGDAPTGTRQRVDGAGNGGLSLPGMSPAAGLWRFAKENALLLWAIGACAAMVWYFAAYLAYTHKIRVSGIPPQAADMAVFLGLCKDKRVGMIYNRFAETPMLIGVLRPCIVVPELAYVQNGMGRDLANILRHELVHYRRKDLLIKWLIVAVSCVHWFNPFVWIIRKEMFRACELACDEVVISGMTRREKQWYGNTLLALSAKRRLPTNVTATTMCEGKRELKERLISIMKYNPKRSWMILPAVLLVAVIAGCAAVLGPVGSASLNGTTPSASMPAVSASAAVTPTNAPTGTPVVGIPPGGSGAEADGGRAFAAVLEESTLGLTFAGMDNVIMNSILAEYGTLCDNFEFIGRVSTDRKYAYIIGEYSGAGPNHFTDLKSTSVDDSIILYDKDSEKQVEAALTASPEERNLGGLCQEITKSAVQYSADNPLVIYIEPKSVQLSLLKVAYEYITGRNEYILDAISRGVMLSVPDVPFITVYRIADRFGEVSEYIPLTSDQLDAAILDESLMKNQKGQYFMVELQTKDDRETYNNRSGIPRSLLDIIVQKCAYRFEEPSDLGTVVSAQLTVKLTGLERSQTVTEAAQLKKLDMMLKKAKPLGSMSGCGFGGQLVLTFDNGDTMTLYKGCDDCDTIVFGSYGCYAMGKDNNIVFWEIFDEAAAGWRDKT